MIDKDILFHYETVQGLRALVYILKAQSPENSPIWRRCLEVLGMLDEKLVEAVVKNA